MTREGKKRNTYRILAAQYYRRRPLGKHRFRREDNSKVGLTNKMRKRGLDSCDTG